MIKKRGYVKAVLKEEAEKWLGLLKGGNIYARMLVGKEKERKGSKKVEMMRERKNKKMGKTKTNILSGEKCPHISSGENSKSCLTDSYDKI